MLSVEFFSSMLGFSNFFCLMSFIWLIHSYQYRLTDLHFIHGDITITVTMYTVNIIIQYLNGPIFTQWQTSKSWPLPVCLDCSLSISPCCLVQEAVFSYLWLSQAQYQNRHLPAWSQFLFMESVRDCLLENKRSRQEPLIDLALPLCSHLYFLMWLLSFVSFLIAWNVVLELNTFSFPFLLITVFWAMYFSHHCLKLIFQHKDMKHQPDNLKKQHQFNNQNEQEVLPPVSRKSLVFLIHFYFRLE